MEIKAPYNFVPLNDTVVFAERPDQVSHDMPFSDGESGVISATITAESHIFIRDGHSIGNQTSIFSNINSKYFIPGSTTKGMIRSVLEILSFAKLNESQINLWKPTYRDLSGTEYKKNMQNIQCGWLQASDTTESGYEIVDLGIPERIDHIKIDAHFGNTNFQGKFWDLSEEKDALTSNDKIAKVKYLLLGVTDNKGNGFNYKNLEMPAYNATLICTGQPGYRQGSRKGKHLEFLFPDKQKSKIEISNKVYKNFLFAYYDDDRNNESRDWIFWKTLFENSEIDKIPVFFKKVNGRVKHFGLSMLYKLPYDNGIDTFWEKYSSFYCSKKYDLSETIFGSINGNALKGRVQFSHAFTDNAEELSEKNKLLSSPKPSYYPTYIKGDGYNSKESKLSGRKRYPFNANATAMQGSDTTGTKFKPLNKGAKFKLKIRFHNLRKIEIGALLSAITFHGTENAYHSVGMAKPIGYGKINFAIEELIGLKFDINEYLKAFETFMEKETQYKWSNSEQLKELLTMASEQHESVNEKLNYMSLNEHGTAKAEKETLPYFSALEGVKAVSLTALLSADEKEKIKAEQKKELKAAQQKKKLEESIDRIQQAQKGELNDNLEMTNWRDLFEKDKTMAFCLIDKIVASKRKGGFTKNYIELSDFLGKDIDVVKKDNNKGMADNETLLSSVENKAEQFLSGHISKFPKNLFKKLKKKNKGLAKKVAERLKKN